MYNKPATGILYLCAGVPALACGLALCGFFAAREPWALPALLAVAIIVCSWWRRATALQHTHDRLLAHLCAVYPARADLRPERSHLRLVPLAEDLRYLP
jgi:hypothetical protein